MRVWLLLLVKILTLSTVRAVSPSYLLCKAVPACHELYRLDGVGNFPSESQFVAETTQYLYGAKMEALGFPSRMKNDAIDTSETVSRLLLGRLILSDAGRCPPNTYWLFDPRTNESHCPCFLDRDCSVEATTVCTDTSSPILVALIVILAILVALDFGYGVVTFSRRRFT